MKYGKILIILFLMCLLSGNGYSLFVDYTAFFQRKTIWGSLKKYWDTYNEKFKFIIEKQISENCSMAYSQELMSDEDAEGMKPRLEEVMDILQSPFFMDCQQMDPWTALFRNALDGYQPIEGFDFLYEDLNQNPFYSGELKELTDLKIEQERRKIDLINQEIAAIKKQREIEKNLFERCEVYDTYIMQFATKDAWGRGKTNDTKLLTIINYLEYDIVTVQSLILGEIQKSMTADITGKIEKLEYGSKALKIELGQNKEN